MPGKTATANICGLRFNIFVHRKASRITVSGCFDEEKKCGVVNEFSLYTSVHAFERILRIKYDFVVNKTSYIYY